MMLHPDTNNEPTSPYIPDTPGAFPSAQPATPNNKRGGWLRTGAILLLTLVLAVVFGTGLFAGWQFGHTNTLSQVAVPPLQPGTPSQVTIPTSTGNNGDAVREAVIAKVKPTVVQVNVSTGRSAGIGSGVVIDKRGYIVTNDHVVNGAQNIQVVLYNASSLPAQLIGTDPADDLAVIKINPPANIAVITIGNSSQLQVGQEVLAVGNPLGITQTVTWGIISALNRNVDEGQGGAVLPGAIQTDAPINPGNSGGALVDMQGNLIGIPTLTAIDPEFNTPANGVGFAIPSNRVKLIAPQIIATGRVAHTGRAALGLMNSLSVDRRIATLDGLSVDHGVLIVDLVPNGGAARAGLQVGDIIVQIGSQAVNDGSSLTDALANKNPGDSVTVKVVRGNQQLTVNVTLGELQAGQ